MRRRAGPLEVVAAVEDQRQEADLASEAAAEEEAAGDQHLGFDLA